jgi:hypothetical protein|tara:strand:- start:393 stop:746 length:354 start_codon:yes stop_codon:yes gene_type:complete
MRRKERGGELNRKKSMRNRDIGIKQSLDNANEKEPFWSEEALEYLKRYPHVSFMAEQVRVWAYANGLRLPPHNRAWGGVINKASKAGLIIHSGYSNVTNPKAHSTPASVWTKVGGER